MARGTPAQQARRPAGIGVPGKRNLGYGRGSIDKRLARSGRGGCPPKADWAPSGADGDPAMAPVHP